MNKCQHVEKIVKEHVFWSFGAGLVPIPLLDIAAVTVVQLDMLKQICRAYDQDFSDSEGKVFLSALTGSTLARLGASLIKGLPGIGSLLGGLSMSIMSGASTYAVAQVAIRHFKTGGSFFDFDLDDAKEKYEEFFEAGKEYAENLKKEQKASKTSADDVIARLEKLAQLKEKGILTEEEFEAKKQELLERL